MIAVHDTPARSAGLPSTRHGAVLPLARGGGLPSRWLSTWQMTTSNDNSNDGGRNSQPHRGIFWGGGHSSRRGPWAFLPKFGRLRVCAACTRCWAEWRSGIFRAPTVYWRRYAAVTNDRRGERSGRSRYPSRIAAHCCAATTPDSRRTRTFPHRAITTCSDATSPARAADPAKPLPDKAPAARRRPARGAGVAFPHVVVANSRQRALFSGNYVCNARTDVRHASKELAWDWSKRLKR